MRRAKGGQAALEVGVRIVLTVMALNFIGDALRDSMDVRLRRR